MSSGQASAPAPEGYQPECVDYLLQVASQKVTSQGNAFDQLDSKMGVMLGFATVAVLQVWPRYFNFGQIPARSYLGIHTSLHPHSFWVLPRLPWQRHAGYCRWPQRTSIMDLTLRSVHIARRKIYMN